MPSVTFIFVLVPAAIIFYRLIEQSEKQSSPAAARRRRRLAWLFALGAAAFQILLSYLTVDQGAEPVRYQFVLLPSLTWLIVLLIGYKLRPWLRV